MMRSGRASALVFLVLMSIAAAGPARAEGAETCPHPAEALSTESPLPRVTEAIRGGRPLEILVVGSRSSSITGAPEAAYPARLAAALKESFPAATVNMTLEIEPKQTAEETGGALSRLLEAKAPTLVIWQTGTVDAMRAVDPEDFRSAVDAGVATLQSAGVDVVLMNLQYSPRTETMISGSPYMDNMRAVAQAHDVPLFDRFALMRQWSEEGDFDLFSAAHGLELAKRVHDCIGRALSSFIIDAAHVGQAQQN